jgi:hypothetical protein
VRERGEEEGRGGEGEERSREREGERGRERDRDGSAFIILLCENIIATVLKVLMKKGMSWPASEIPLVFLASYPWFCPSNPLVFMCLLVRIISRKHRHLFSICPDTGTTKNVW